MISNGHNEKQHKSVATSRPVYTGPVPMELDTKRYQRLTNKDREILKAIHGCFYCRKPGHIVSSCQLRPLKVIRTKAVTNHKNFKRRNFVEDNISSSAISDDSSEDSNSECNNMPIKVMSMRSGSKARKSFKLSVKRSENPEDKKATDELV